MRVDEPQTGFQELMWGARPPIFRFTRRFRGLTAPVAFRGIESWLQKERGKVTKSSIPESIAAKHGSWTVVSGWARNAKKKLQFRIRQIEGGVEIELDVEPAFINKEDVLAQEEMATANWDEMATDLWRHLGDKGATPQVEIDWGEILWEGNLQVRFGGYLTLGGIGIFALMVVTTGMIQTLVGLVGGGIIGAGALLLVHGAIKASGARKRMERESAPPAGRR